MTLRPEWESVDILKLDVEGCEGRIVRALVENGGIENVRWLRGEYHGDAQGHQLLRLLAPTHRVKTYGASMFIAHRKGGAR